MDKFFVGLFVGVIAGIAISIGFVHYQNIQSLKPKFDTVHFLACSSKARLNGCN